MITNNLHSFFADPAGLTFHHASGRCMASVTAEGVEAHAADLRPEEHDHLSEVAADFYAYHAANFDGENYNQQSMPLVKP